MKSSRKLQIGVMGSAADLSYKQDLENLAEAVGRELANNNAYLIFGAEKDCDSLPTAASRGAKAVGGITIGVTYGKGKEIWQPDADIILPTGLERGGGREMVLVLACDAIITIGGGSGTLTEIAIAYQANIPIISLEDSGGWSGRLVGEYLDSRQRLKIIPAQTAKEAVKLALMSIDNE